MHDHATGQEEESYTDWLSDKFSSYYSSAGKGLSAAQKRTDEVYETVTDPLGIASATESGESIWSKMSSDFSSVVGGVGTAAVVGATVVGLAYVYSRSK